ncbi:MAG: ABC transporter permease [Candidatus Sumerlaeota bacterium]|nr:ABC transporter permease [Candidatus Sumerlaeota bacterium]
MNPGQEHIPKSDAPFLAALCILGGFYLFMIVAIVAADFGHSGVGQVLAGLRQPEIQYSVKLSLVSSVVTALLSIWVGVPIGYLLSRFRFPGKSVIDATLDIPIVLPPIVVGLSLLILFKTPAFRALGLDNAFIFTRKGVVAAQFMVACAFAVRIMRTTFDDIPARKEEIAFTLGCSRSDAFWRIVLPEARNGVLAAATVTWARALVEFGPILVFAGTTRMKTEVLPSTVFLELGIGEIDSAVAISLLMIVCALAVMIVFRMMAASQGLRPRGGRR